MIDPRTGSHPAVRFDSHPPVVGPLSQLVKGRDSIIEEDTQRTFSEFESRDLRSVLEETLYLERLRLKKQRISWTSPYLRNRKLRDQQLFSRLNAEMNQGLLDSDPKRATQDLVHHYASEICGNFHPSVYKFATNAVPWGFSWLLNAASLNRILPWGMSESLATRMRVVGEVPHLQKLAQKGTILFVPTHLSNIDSILVGWVLHLMSLPPFAYGGGLNLFSNPVLSFLMSRLGAYTVDRQKTSLMYKSTLKNYSTTILKHGIHSIFFPGGGRGRSGAIENHLKLGLLGTALQAQIENLQDKKEKPNLYVVPMVMSYHFVFEAASLISEFLAQTGKHRFRPNDSAENLPLVGLAKFFWKIFSSRTEMWIRIGKPLDVFGNFVDEEGQSIGPNGTTIDVASWVTSGGVLGPNACRDREYTQLLGERLVERYHAENLILTSHAAAFTLFEILRKQYPNLDVYHFLRLTPSQRVVTKARFYEEAEKVSAMLQDAYKAGRLYLSDALHCGDVELWVEEGVRQLGLFHDEKVMKFDMDTVTTESMELLYYYRNRMTGYGFAGFAIDGEYNVQGFLV